MKNYNVCFDYIFEIKWERHTEEKCTKCFGKMRLPREEFFVTTKIWISNAGYEKARTIGVVVIPKPTHKERMEENFNIFDFKLTGQEMAEIEALDGGDSSDCVWRSPSLCIGYS